MAEEKTTDKNKTTGLDQFSLDKVKGFEMGTIKSKTVDQSATDEYLSQIEKPSGGSVYDKMAARYRSQGEGDVLRTQKNLNNLFLPTINLIKEREAAAEARFTLLKDKMPEFDDSTIFGNQSGNEMPIKDYVMGISKSVKEDLRMLSRLNVNDERYDEVKKRVEKNQEAIVNFDEINKKLLEIRNSQDGREDHTQWSKGMDQTTIDMWRDIYASKGENIKIVDGKLIWTSTGGKSEEIKTKSNALSSLSSITETPTDKEDVKKLQKNLVDLGYDISVDGVYGPKTKAAYKKFLNDKESIESEVDSAELEGVGDTKTIDLSQIGEGPTLIDNKGTNMDIALRGETQKFIEMGGKVDDPMYNQMIKSKLFELNKIGPQGLKSLIFDGIGLEDTDMFTGSNTDSFIEKVIADTYAGGDIRKLSEKEIEGYIQQMKSGDVTLDYNDGEGSTSSLQSLFMKWYKGEIDDAITEGVKSKVVASSNPSNNNNNNNKNNNTLDIPDPIAEGERDPSIGMIDQYVTTDQKNNLWKEFWNKSEGDAEIALKKIFGDNTEFGFTFVQRVGGQDWLEVYDKNGQSIGTYGFDWSGPERAKEEADRFLKDLNNAGYNTPTKVETREKEVTPTKTYKEITKMLPAIDANEDLLAMQSDASQYTNINGSKVSFIVQQGVVDKNYGEGALNNSYGKGASLYKIESGGSGSTYGVINGVFGSLSEAEFRKSEVSQNGFSDSFIIAIIDGKRVKVEDAITFLNK